MKFPRTRRDRLKNEIKRQKAVQKQQDDDDVDTDRKPPLPFTAGSSLALPSERVYYPPNYVPDAQKRGFDQESVPPLGANVESWSNLVDSRATSNPDNNETYGEGEFEDDVFFHDDDMRRLRLGITDPNSPYYMYPAAYTTMAMMGAIPAESHFGQGLEYFGPGYHVGSSCSEIFFCLWNMLTYILDVGSDMYLAYLYFTNGYYAWFGLTIGFVAVPAITMSIFSLMLYLRDYKVVGERRSGCRWATRLIFILLQMAPLFRLFETMVYGCKSRDPDLEILQRRRFYDKMVNEDTDAMLLRLFESFMEAAPQLVLQLYIITQIGLDEGTGLVVLQVFGLVTSLLSLAGCLVSYQRALRLSQPDKEKLRFPGMSLMFVWRLWTIAARVIALAMFASYFHYWVFIVIGVHWVAMLIWILKQKTCFITAPKIPDDNIEKTDNKNKSQSNKCHEIFFGFLCAFVHIFCFFNLLEGHTRLRYILFYGVMYLENIVLIMGWYVGASMKTISAWYHLPALITVLCGFWIGIFFMGLYYRLYHPNNSSVLNSRRRILWCIPFTHLSLTQEIQFYPDLPGSVMHRSQLSLNQSYNQSLNQTQQSANYPYNQNPNITQQSHNYPYAEERPMALNPAIDSLRKTPIPGPIDYPDNRSSTITDRNSYLSSMSGNSSYRPGRIVQKKWQPAERQAAGQEKLNLSMDSGSTSTSLSTGPKYISSTPESRATRRAERVARSRARKTPPTVVDNNEPLPQHVPRTERIIPGRQPAQIYIPDVQRTPPVLKMASLPRDESPLPDDIPRYDAPIPEDTNPLLRYTHAIPETESCSESDEEDYPMNDTEPLTNTDQRPLPILEEDDELPVEDELPPGARQDQQPMLSLKMTAI